MTNHPQVTLESAPHLPLWDQKLEARKQENPQNRWPDNWIRRPILGEHHLLDLHLFQQPVPFKQANDVLFTGVSWGIFCLSWVYAGDAGLLLYFYIWPCRNVTVLDLNYSNDDDFKPQVYVRERGTKFAIPAF